MAQFAADLRDFPGWVKREARLVGVPHVEPLEHPHLRLVWTVEGHPGLWRYVKPCSPGHVAEPGRVVARHGDLVAVYARLADLEALVREAVAPRQEATAGAAV